MVYLYNTRHVLFGQSWFAEFYKAYVLVPYLLVDTPVMFLLVFEMHKFDLSHCVGWRQVNLFG